jgi:RNA 3'-terminal phosphate cyclase-like protein
LLLVAESTTNTLLGGEELSDGTHKKTPEDVGIEAARRLLDEISRGGCIDTNHQWMCLLLMVLCSEDVSKVRLGKLTEFTIQIFRDIKTIFGVQFNVKTDGDTVLASCIGAGFANFNKKAT